MKKIVMFFMITIMFVAFFGSQMVRAESYQRWISFVNEPNHVMTASELADITTSLSRREISAQNTYRLSTGITYKIPQPDLFLRYIVMCIKEGEPSIITIDDVVREIQGGEVARWGNDISVRVKNYYFSSLHGRVQFIDNYSGNDVADGVFVLLIHGKPKIKMDCGNPLWVIGGEIGGGRITPQRTTSDSKITESEVGNHNVIDTGKPKTKSTLVGNLNPNPPAKERKVIKIRVGDVVVTIAVVALVVEAIRLLFPHKIAIVGGVPGGAPTTTDNGDAGGARTTTDTNTTDTGGPGGAPTTK